MKKGLKVLLLMGLGVMLVSCDWLNVEQVLPPTAAPAGVVASCGTASRSITISWQAVERATSYEAFRAETEDGDYAKVGTASGTSFTDSVESQGKWYWYKVRACNSAGCGPESAPVRGYAGPPPAPENVRASQGDPDKIMITWDPVPGADYYHVFRDRVPEGTYPVQVAQYVTEARVEDANVSLATWYWYKVQACKDSVGCSVLSEAAGGYRGPYPIPFGNEDEGGS